jgi:hypothetical protein
VPLRIIGVHLPGLQGYEFQRCSLRQGREWLLPRLTLKQIREPPEKIRDRESHLFLSFLSPESDQGAGCVEWADRPGKNLRRPLTDHACIAIRSSDSAEGVIPFSQLHVYYLIE